MQSDTVNEKGASEPEGNLSFDSASYSIRRRKMNGSKIVLLGFFLLVFISSAQSITINVPTASCPTIQAGIDAASGDDEVIVAAGTYTGLGNVNLDFHGKAITLSSENVNVPESCTIDCQNAANTVGFRFQNGESSSSVIQGFTIQNATDGGGISCDYGSSPTIRGNIIRWNSRGGGGGIFCWNGSSPTIVGNTISDNVGTSFGGGIYCNYSSSPVIEGNTIRENTAGLRGGGIYCENSSSPRIEHNNIKGNRADGDEGGGIYCATSSFPDIIENDIIENTAYYSGGGILCNNDSSPLIARNTIRGNTAGLRGGGICIHPICSPRIENNDITENTAEYGGGISCYLASATITNNTMTRNTAEYGGGIFLRRDSSLTITNTIVWGNDPQEIYFYEGDQPSTVTISYSDIECGETEIVTNNNGIVNWGNGVIRRDPVFVDVANHIYSLSDFSPCIGAATMDDVPPGVVVPTEDIEGNDRPSPPDPNSPDPSPDMGAYESDRNQPVGLINNSPIADAGPDQIGDEGSQINFDASGSSDRDCDVLMYRWDFDNDGTWDTGWLNNPDASNIWYDDWAGTARVQVSDGDLTDTDTAAVEINNVAPVAVNDAVQINEDIPVNINVLINDSDVGNDLLVVISVFPPLNGLAVINADGTVGYTPDANFSGADNFTHRIDDGDNGVDDATVNVIVNAVNDAPVAVDDEVQTNADMPVTIDVLINDFDVDGDPLTVTDVTDPTNGLAVINADGTVDYTPDAN